MRQRRMGPVTAVLTAAAAVLSCGDAVGPGPRTPSGGCNPACSPGYSCQGNVCVASSPGGCNPPCTGGYTCRGGACERDAPAGCSPPCSDGYACQGGTCVQRTRYLPPGSDCTSDAQCCADRECTSQGLCVGGGFFGPRRVCAAPCSSDSQCTSGCCYTLSNGQGACNAPLLAPRGQPCRSSQCCEGALLCTRGRCG